MQETFLKKLVLCLIISACLAGFVEFYKTFIEGADQALNGKHPHVRKCTPCRSRIPEPLPALDRLHGRLEWRIGSEENRT